MNMIIQAGDGRYDAEPEPIDDQQRRFFEHLRSRAQDGTLREWWDNLQLGSCLAEWYKLAIEPARKDSDPLLNGEDTPGLWVC